MQSPTQAEPYQSRQTVTPPHVCIVGGGFGGLYTALYLAKRCRQSRQPCAITLIEPRDRFVFTPLLYELLTDEVKPWEIGPAYRSLLAGTPIRHRQTWADRFHLADRQVELTGGERVPYDYLVVAMGSRDRSLPVPGWADHTYRFRTFADVEQLNHRLADLEAKGNLPIRVAIVGGGPSGVELSCKLADRLGARGQLQLIDRGDRILKPYPDRMRRAAMRSLAQRRVNLHLNTEVAAVEPHTLHVQNDEGEHSLPIDLVIGVAGTETNDWLDPAAAVDFTDQGSVQTQPTLQLPNYPEVFVVGDQAQMPWQADRSAPPTAQAAYQAAAAIAKNLVAAMGQRSLHTFRYTHLGDMMTLGQRNGMVAVGGFVLRGWLAGLIRQAAYTYRLPPGGRHRWRVLRYRLGRIWHWLWH